MLSAVMSREHFLTKYSVCNNTKYSVYISTVKDNIMYKEIVDICLF